MNDLWVVKQAAGDKKQDWMPNRDPGKETEHSIYVCVSGEVLNFEFPVFNRYSN